MANPVNEVDAQCKSKIIYSDPNEVIYLEETFYILPKKNSVFRVRLTSSGLVLRKETEDSYNEQKILLKDIIGSKCMRSKRRYPGVSSCVCSSLVGHQNLKVVEENSRDLDENDISAYLYIHAYVLKHRRRTIKRERMTITLRFRSFDKYEDNNKEAQKWRSTIKSLICGDTQSPLNGSNDKKYLIILNPKSGSGKSKELFSNKVVHILQEAEIPYEVHITKNPQYARELVRTRNIYGWRGLVAVGGDGVLFEIMNGLFERLDWQKVLAEVPLAILPCGSGNGLARTICHHYNEPYSHQSLMGIAVALCKGNTAPMDVVRVETKTRIMFSFLSIGWGLLADIDIESERLRKLGSQRFALWAVARVIGLRKYKGVVSYVRIRDVESLPKPKFPQIITHSVSQDGMLDSPDSEVFIDCEESETKTSMPNGKRYQRADSWYSVNSRRSAFYSARSSEFHSVISDGSDVASPSHACMHGPASRLPSLVTQLPQNWESVDGEFVMVYVAYQSYIGEDFLFAPRSQLSDGVMWLLMVKAGIPRSQLVSFLLNGNSGAHADVNNEFMKMIPVSAFRIVPEGSNGHITVDGERVDYGPIQAEIFPDLVRVVVPDNK